MVGARRTRVKRRVASLKEMSSRLDGVRVRMKSRGREYRPPPPFITAITDITANSSDSDTPHSADLKCYYRYQAAASTGPRHGLTQREWEGGGSDGRERVW